MSGVGLVAYVFIALFVALLGWWGYRLFKRGKKPESNLPAETYEDVSEQVIKPHGEGDVQIGVGPYWCLCFRKEEYNVKESPEYAWFAISWDIVKRVFFVPTQWFKSSTVWFAVGMMAITFVVSLAII